MTRKPSTAKSPTVHTALIGDPITMWEKLAWDVDQFQDIQRSYPDETQPLAFAAINVCIAAWSLEQWVRAAWIKQRRSAGEKADESLFYKTVRQLVPTQAICASVANTAKHVSHREDDDWKGGEVRIRWEDGDENGPSTYTLHYVDESGASNPGVRDI